MRFGSSRRRTLRVLEAESEPPPFQQPSVNLGERVRKLRNDRNLTIAVLSERSGIAGSTLSKIENNRLSPTYDTLVRLMRGLEVSIEALFSDSIHEPMGRRSVTRRGQGLKYVTDSYDYEMLCSDISEKKIIPIHTRLKAHSREHFGALIEHEGEEIIYVLSGKVELLTRFYEPIILEAGDCAFFDSRMAHACLAHGLNDAEILWLFSDRGALRIRRNSGASVTVKRKR